MKKRQCAVCGLSVSSKWVAAFYFQIGWQFNEPFAWFWEYMKLCLLPYCVYPLEHPFKPQKPIIYLPSLPQSVMCCTPDSLCVVPLFPIPFERHSSLYSVFRIPGWTWMCLCRLSGNRLAFPGCLSSQGVQDCITATKLKQVSKMNAESDFGGSFFYFRGFFHSLLP